MNIRINAAFVKKWCELYDAATRTGANQAQASVAATCEIARIIREQQSRNK